MSEQTYAYQAVEWFNKTHAVGTPVSAWPGTKEGRCIHGKTRTPAWVVGDQPVVSVTGYAGGIALSHVVCKSHPTHDENPDAPTTGSPA